MRTVRSITIAVLLGLGSSGAISAAESESSPASLTQVIQTNCAVCHNDVLREQFAGLSLQHYDVAQAAEFAPITEKMIVKLRAGMMPPPGMPRPSEPMMESLIQTLEDQVDLAAAENPNPGHRSFQRLNQAEYEAAIKDLLALDINAEDYLPLDTKSSNFDNIADVQILPRKQAQKKALNAPFSEFLSKYYFLLDKAPKRFLKRSTRPPLSSIFCLPV